MKSLVYVWDGIAQFILDIVLSFIKRVLMQSIIHGMKRKITFYTMKFIIFIMTI